MDRRKWLLLSGLLAMIFLLSACPDPDPDPPPDDAIELDTPTWPEPGDPGEPVLADILVVDRSAPDADAAIRFLQEIGTEQRLEQTDLVNPDIVPDIAETAVFQAVVAEVAIFELSEIPVDRALQEIEARDIQAETVAPIHRLSASGHWSAFPGTRPFKVPSQKWDDGVSEISTRVSSRTIGIVDTGIASDSPNAQMVGPDWHATDSHHEICDGALHGEAVASAIKQVNPSAEVYSANAFPRPNNCWVTTEFDVMVATALLQSHNINYDVINFSLGTTAYHYEEGGTRFPPIVLRIIMRDIPAVVAAGNAPGDEPIYPAADTTAVRAADPSGAAVVWDENGQPIPPVSTTSTVVAPGCALILQGMSDGSGGLDESQVVVWAGSSFASPIYAAVGGSVVDSTAPGDLYSNILPERMNNNASNLYPSAPTDC